MALVEGVDVAGGHGDFREVQDKFGKLADRSVIAYRVFDR